MYAWWATMLMASLGAAMLSYSMEVLQQFVPRRVPSAHDWLLNTGGCLLGAVLARWYDGDNAMVYADLITGLPQRTLTMEENLALWDLAALIRRDEALLGLFRTSDAREFFQRVLDADKQGNYADRVRELTGPAV